MPSAPARKSAVPTAGITIGSATITGTAWSQGCRTSTPDLPGKYRIAIAIRGNVTGIAIHANTVSGALRNGGSPSSPPSSDPPVEVPAHASVLTISNAVAPRGRRSSSTTAAPTIETISTIGPSWTATTPSDVVHGRAHAGGRSTRTCAALPSAWRTPTSSGPRVPSR